MAKRGVTRRVYGGLIIETQSFSLKPKAPKPKIRISFVDYHATRRVYRVRPLQGPGVGGGYGRRQVTMQNLVL